MVTPMRGSHRLTPVIIRPRQSEDLPVLEELLTNAQPHTGYPSTWPLSMSAREFIARDREVGAWVAVVDETVVGHVGVTHPDPEDELTPHWVADTGLDVESLGLIGALFIDHRLTSRGIGTTLLDHAVAQIRSHGWVPILDVLDEQATAKTIYHNRGWRPVAVAHPAWAPRNIPVTCMVLDDRKHH